MFPPALPLDPILTGVQTDPFVVVGLVVMVLAIFAAIFAAVMYSRGDSPTSRARRSPQAPEGVDASPEGASASSPFPNLLGK